MVGTLITIFSYSLKNPINTKSLRNLATCWQNCCKKSGLKVPDHVHGCDLREGKYADKYVSKWGLADEVTKGHIKKGKEDSVTLGTCLGNPKKAAKIRALVPSVRSSVQR